MSGLADGAQPGQQPLLARPPLRPHQLTRPVDGRTHPAQRWQQPGQLVYGAGQPLGGQPRKPRWAAVRGPPQPITRTLTCVHPIPLSGSCPSDAADLGAEA